MSYWVEHKGAKYGSDVREEFRHILEDLGLREPAAAPTPGEGRSIIGWTWEHVESLWMVLSGEQKKLLLDAVDLVPPTGMLTAAFSEATNNAHNKGGVGKRNAKINELVTERVSASLPRPVRLDPGSGGDRLMQVDRGFAAAIAAARDEGIDLS
jgi:hypothetical protein